MQKLLTQMLQELSPMTPFHLKLYYLLTDKNTGTGGNMGGGNAAQMPHGGMSSHHH